MKRRVFFGLLFAVVVGTAGGWLWLNGQGNDQTTPVEAKTTTPPSPLAKKVSAISFDPQPPKHITIPAINVSASVIAVGKERNGAMEVPTDNATVGWYESGYLPGAKGNAVLAGHYGDSKEMGVFRSLEKLKPHDRIAITTTTRTMRFEVQKKKIYAHDAGRRKELFGKSKFAQLQLITCDGAWDVAHASYLNRLVVTARFVSEEPL